MRHHLIAMAALTTAACAPMTPQPSALSTAETQVRAAEAEWTAAVAARNMAAVEAMLAPEFTLTGDDMPPGGIPRGLWLSNLGKMTISDYVVNVERVTPTTDGAIAEVSGHWTVAMGGPTMNHSFRLRDHWVRRSGRWQVTNRHSMK